MNSIGVITRCVATALRGVFTRQATLPSSNTLTRALATAGRAMYRHSRSSAVRSSAATLHPRVQVGALDLRHQPARPQAHLRARPLVVVVARNHARTSSKNTRDTASSSDASRATGSRSAHGNESTHCRYGTAGSTRSHCVAAVSLMRRPPQLEHTPRRLHENATSRSWPQPAHRARMNPHASTPHRSSDSNSSVTYRGSERPLSDIRSAKAAK